MFVRLPALAFLVVAVLTLSPDVASASPCGPVSYAQGGSMIRQCGAVASAATWTAAGLALGIALGFGAIRVLQASRGVPDPGEMLPAPSPEGTASPEPPHNAEAAAHNGGPRPAPERKPPKGHTLHQRGGDINELTNERKQRSEAITGGTKSGTQMGLDAWKTTTAMLHPKAPPSPTISSPPPLISVEGSLVLVAELFAMAAIRAAPGAGAIVRRGLSWFNDVSVKTFVKVTVR